MTLSNRIMRAGLAFLVFGACAALVPNNGGLVLADTGTCSTGTGSTNTSSSGSGVSTSQTVGDISLFLLGGYLLSTALDSTAATTITTASSDTGSTSSEVGYNLATSEFQFDYGTSNQG
jgi:hypothetical protein